MRVLHLDSGTQMRGGQWQVLSLLQGLGAGHTLLTPADGPLMRAALARGIESQPLNMCSITGIAKKVDLIHAHDARSHTWAATLTSTSLIVSRRVAFPVRQSFLSRWKYGRANRYVAISEHVKRMLLEAEVPEGKISVVYDGVEIPDNLSRGGRVVSLRTEDPMKGADLVAEAARIGGFEVHFSTDLPADLASAGVFLYVTRSEGLGSAALLAMAAGVPVVASRVGGLPEVVEHGRTGLLVDNEPTDIAAAVQRACQNREEWGRNSRKSVEERFSARQMVERTREVYGQVLG
jgi:Glycosyl transferases group 1/Glycosyltransferase Family 4